MFKFLDQIQRLPKERRKMFAFAAASSLTALVVAVWVVDLNRRFGTPAPEEAADELRGELSPFATLKRSAGDLVDGAKERFQAVEESAAALQGFSGEGGQATSTVSISTTTPESMTSSTPKTQATSTEVGRRETFESATTSFNRAAP
jgi:hypothetical protein